MATERITVTFCDVCLTDGPRVEGETLKVSINAESATVDLCPRHERELLTPVRNLLAAHGRGKNKPEPVSVAAAPTAGKKASNAEVRRWAQDNGIEVSKSGRVPAEIVERYAAAHQQSGLRLA